MVVGRETAQGLRVLVMTKTKFNEIVSSGSEKVFGADVQIYTVKDEFQRNNIDDDVLGLQMSDAT
eukprot:9092126-Karenia_brevis.AAC.1